MSIFPGKGWKRNIPQKTVWEGCVCSEVVIILDELGSNHSRTSNKVGMIPISKKYIEFSRDVVVMSLQFKQNHQCESPGSAASHTARRPGNNVDFGGGTLLYLLDGIFPWITLVQLDYRIAWIFSFFI